MGGAATKITHLIRLLHRDFRITVVAPELWALKDKRVRQILAPYGIPCVLLKELPKRLDGVALGICDGDFFISGRARGLKERGLRLVWSNEMMFPFKGEAEAAKEGLVDRVLFVSPFQASAFAEIHQSTASLTTGNYIDPEDKLLVHGESGFICRDFQEFRSCVRELYEDYPLRLRISRNGAAHARERLCNPEEHRRRWIQALTF